MSFPSGYKRLEYIQSTGTQYVDTNVVPSLNHGFKVRFQPSDLNGDNIYIGCATSGSQYWGGETYNAEHAYMWNRGATVSGTVFVGQTYTTSLNYKNDRKFIVDGVVVASLSAVSITTTPIRIFGFNNGSTSFLFRGKIFGVEITFNDEVICDFIPCQKPDGTNGLWDDVNSVFYGNAGTGTFTEGPVVITVPSTPLNFILSSSTDTTVTLSWDAVENATGYKLYRNGSLVTILFSTSYTDTIESFTDYAYTLTAYNENGESNPATLDVFVIIPPVQPKYFNFIGANNSSIWLSWQPVNHADTYKLYRDGTLLHETRDTKYTDTKLNVNTQYNYTLVASNSSGDSPKSNILKASTISLDLVYDRTQEDGNKIAQYIQAKFSNLSEEQQAEWLSYHSKGGWNYTDLNRIEYWIGYITELLGLYIESLDDIPKFEASWDKRSNLYVEDVTHIQEVIELLKTKFKFTEFDLETMQRGPNWDYKQANAIERNLKTLYEQFHYMYIWPICGDATCGGDYL